MIISIHQPQYMPWYGYFKKIKMSDVFVFLDNVQYKKNEWQNRNRIKTKNGMQWLTVPVRYKFGQAINTIEINGHAWIRKHVMSIEQTYKCKDNERWLKIKEVLERRYEKLSDLNIDIVKCICNILDIDVDFVIASDLNLKANNPDDRIIEIVEKLGGKIYIAGAGGKNYMNTKKYPFKILYNNYIEDEPISIIGRIL